MVSSCYTIFPIWIVRKLMRNIAVPKLIFETNELIAPFVKPVFDSIELFLAVFTFFRVLGVVDTSLLAAPRCSFSFFQKKDRYWRKVRDLPPYRFLSYYLESAHQHSLRHLFSSWQQWIILKKKALLLLVWKGLEMSMDTSPGAPWHMKGDERRAVDRHIIVRAILVLAWIIRFLVLNTILLAFEYNWNMCCVVCEMIDDLVLVGLFDVSNVGDERIVI